MAAPALMMPPYSKGLRNERLDNNEMALNRYGEYDCKDCSEGICMPLPPLLANRPLNVELTEPNMRLTALFASDSAFKLLRTVTRASMMPIRSNAPSASNLRRRSSNGISSFTFAMVSLITRHPGLCATRPWSSAMTDHYDAAMRTHTRPAQQ